MNFSAEELRRYNRHIILSEIGSDGQYKLKQAKVLVVGAGGLGCPILQYLSAAGVGTLGIIDDDKVEESNLQRQILYNLNDVGANKAERAAEKLRIQNPFITYKIFPERLTKDNALRIFHEFDIVVDGTDNFSTRYLVNDACIILNKPLVFGSIFKFEGQVTVFNYNNGPTYRCLFPEPPGEGEVPNCSEIGVMGVLPGIIGAMQASEVIKIITGIGDILSGKLFVMDTLSMQTQIYKFSKNAKNTTIKELGEYEEFCSVDSSALTNELDVYDLKDLLDENADFQLLDVRTAQEYSICNLGGTNIPADHIADSLEQISKTKKVVVHCHHGPRSRQVVKFLREKFQMKNVYNLKGGIHEWALLIDEEMPTY